MNAVKQVKIYTLGYSGSSHDDLRAYVKATKGIIVDTRFSPWSRNPIWHRQAIAMAVGGENYIHIQGFGNRNYKGDGPIVLANPGAGLEVVRNILNRRRPIILLCVCHHHEICHRTVVANYIASATNLEIEHLPPHFDHWHPTEPEERVFGMGVLG